TAKDDLIITETTLIDFYNIYARNSTNPRLLQDPQGSVVQAGDVRRFGFLLGAEYGVTERFSVTVNVAFFYTQHLNVGENLRLLTNSAPNSQVGFQDLTGNAKFTVFQIQGAVSFAAAAFLGWAIPLSSYNTALDNTLGDGIVSVEPGISLSLALPKGRFFANADFLYKYRGSPH